MTVRDRVSYERVQRWNIPVTLAPDPVWTMVAQPKIEVLHLSSPRIAVNLRSHATLTPIRLQILTKALIDLQNETQATIILLPFQKSLDWDIAQALHTQIPGSKVMLVENPQILKGIFQQVDLTIAMRLHGVIMAASEYCCCYALSYDPKVTRIMEALNLPGIVLSDLSLDADALDSNAFRTRWLQLLNHPFIPDPTPLIHDADRHRDRLQEAFR